MLDSPIEATSPRRTISCLISLMLKRERDAAFAGELTGEGLYGDDDRKVVKNDRGGVSGPLTGRLRPLSQALDDEKVGNQARVAIRVTLRIRRDEDVGDAPDAGEIARGHVLEDLALAALDLPPRYAGRDVAAPPEVERAPFPQGGSEVHAAHKVLEARVIT